MVVTRITRNGFVAFLNWSHTRTRAPCSRKPAPIPTDDSLQSRWLCAHLLVLIAAAFIIIFSGCGLVRALHGHICGERKGVSLSCRRSKHAVCWRFALNAACETGGGWSPGWTAAQAGCRDRCVLLLHGATACDGGVGLARACASRPRRRGATGTARCRAGFGWGQVWDVG